jgi:hypothetical protein
MASFSIPATIAITVLVGMGLMKVSYRPGRVPPHYGLNYYNRASLFISGSAVHIWDADIHRFEPFSGDVPLKL